MKDEGKDELETDLVNVITNRGGVSEHRSLVGMKANWCLLSGCKEVPC